MKLKKDLGLIDVVCISTGAMISSGLFVLPALAYAKTGSSVFLSYALASALVIPTILAKAELVTALPRSGGIFIFTDRSMGPVMGMLCGLAAWFSLAFKAAFALLGIGIFLSLLEHNFSPLHIKFFAVTCVLFFTFINIIGVKLTARIQSYMVFVLVGVLVLYVASGLFLIKASMYTPFAPMGFGAILSTAGFVFISFAGTTKIAAIGGEVKNPQKNLPLGLFLSWAIGSILYVSVIFITVGLVDHSKLQTSLVPIALGGSVILGTVGAVLVSLAGLLAFITTGNAGILTASRDAMAMGQHKFLPGIFAKVSNRGTPLVSILFTSGFMIVILLALDLEIFVKTASTLKLLLFILANMAVLFFRKNKPEKYQPTFIAPFSPWIYIAGIVFYILLIIDMGKIPILLVTFFIPCGLLWYFIYAHSTIKKDYALIGLIKRSAYIKAKSYYFNEELRELLNEKNKATEDFFEKKIKSCAVINIEDSLHFNEYYKKITEIIAKKIKINTKILLDDLTKQEKDSNIIARSGAAVVFISIPGERIFEIAIVRTKLNDLISDAKKHPIHNSFILVSSASEEHLYFPAIRWLYQIEEKIDFEKEWLSAKNDKELKKLILEAWRNILSS